jgi:ADP-heptose:LPS heptosyltransferase
VREDRQPGDRPDVLVLRALGLGDFLTGLPALRLVRTALPDRRVVLAAPSALAPLCELVDTVDELVHAHELDPIEQPPHRPEWAIDLHGNGPESRALLQPARPRNTLAFAGSEIAWRPDEHEVDRWCRLVRTGLGLGDVATPPIAGSIARPPGPALRPGSTVVHCGAKSPSRRWPPERFAALTARLAAQGHDVVVTGGPQERGVAERIAAEARAPALTTLALANLLRLVADARLVISGDTGVAHAASAYAIPSVVLFGPVSPATWGPPRSPRHVVLWHGDGTGDPHGEQVDAALAQITVGEVDAGAEMALAGTDG